MTATALKVIEKFECPRCHALYSTRKEAEDCMNTLFNPQFKVGQIVFVKSGYHWFDGDKKWVSNPKVKLRGHKSHGNCFDKCCTYEFYYVITAIDTDDRKGEYHRVRYHVGTLAMEGQQGHRFGHTYDSGHLLPKVVKNPPRYVVKSSKALIGAKGIGLI